MNLNPNYRYLIIDTETTGLSVQDDDIIQIGLIVMDYERTITDRFSHYVKPEQFSVDQLKPLIGYITGIDTAQIMSAPPLSQLWNQIGQYFDDKTVVIGHNVPFDLAMLAKHHKLVYADTIDTMDVTKTLLHYQRSYSLEIIHQQLSLQPRYRGYLEGIQLQHHDALSDCLTTYAVLRYCCDRVDEIMTECPTLKYVLSDGQRSRYLEDAHELSGIVSLPTLKAPLASPKTMVDHEYYDWTGLASTSKIGLEHAGFTAALLRLVHPKRKMIIAFAHRAKLDLAKRILADHGITGLGYMRENQYIDPLQLKALGAQAQRDADEASRMLKYCSHYLQGLSVLDHNSPGDFKIYQRMRLHRDNGQADIVLSTHAGIYAALQENLYPDHAILFRDHQWWLSSAQKFYQSGIRVDHLLNTIEGIVYKLQHQHNGVDQQWLTEFAGWREVLWGVFGSQLLTLATQLPHNEQGRIELIGGLPRDLMHQFTSLYQRKDDYLSILYSLLGPNDIVRLTRILTRLDTLLHDGCQIELQTSYQGDNIIISPASTYVDYADFRALFAGRHVIFTQTIGQGTDNITTKIGSHPPTKQITHIKDLDYQGGQRLYIIQSSRNQCRATFDILMKQGLNQQTLLMGENVTGGGNKLIEQARGSKAYVMVGGYDLYMQTLAAQVTFDEVIVIGSLGVLHDQILRDIEFYAS